MSAYEFIEYSPSPSNYWRGIVLFGRNVASYKFALGKALVELARDEREAVSLEELAVPYARFMCEHLRDADKQATSATSLFLQACRAFNRDEVDHAALIETTERLGFQNVIDAFHVIGRGPVPTRFFVDERKSSVAGIRLTDELLRLAAADAALTGETEVRWRLVERAWELSLPVDPSTVGFDPMTGNLLSIDGRRRRSITGARGALNGYQKGACFYCFGPIGIAAKDLNLGQVDHFFPHMLKLTELGEELNLDGVWNLVLACPACNGAGGKAASIPTLRMVERLWKRNEFLISSHDPLREVLITQTGNSAKARGRWLNDVYGRREPSSPPPGMCQLERLPRSDLAAEVVPLLGDHVADPAAGVRDIAVVAGNHMNMKVRDRLSSRLPEVETNVEALRSELVAQRSDHPVDKRQQVGFLLSGGLVPSGDDASGDHQGMSLGHRVPVANRERQLARIDPLGLRDLEERRAWDLLGLDLTCKAGILERRINGRLTQDPPRI